MVQKNASRQTRFFFFLKVSQTETGNARAISFPHQNFTLYKTVSTADILGSWCWFACIHYRHWCMVFALHLQAFCKPQTSAMDNKTSTVTYSTCQIKDLFVSSMSTEIPLIWQKFNVSKCPSTLSATLRATVRSVMKCVK